MSVQPYPSPRTNPPCRRIFDFSTLRTGDIMVHRHQVFSVDGRRSIGEALAEIMAESHQRIPLHSGNPEEINRVITLQDLLAEAAQGNLAKTLNEAGHDPIFVPPISRWTASSTCCGPTSSD